MKFDDGYVVTYPESELENILVLRKRETEGRQATGLHIDEQQMTNQCSVKWGPSEHRNVGGSCTGLLQLAGCGELKRIRQRPPRR